MARHSTGGASGVQHLIRSLVELFRGLRAPTESFSVFSGTRVSGRRRTFGAVGERFGTTGLLEDRCVAAMRRGHPAGRGGLPAEAFGGATLDDQSRGTKL